MKGYSIGDSRPKLVGICGGIGHGKDTAAGVLEREHGWVRVALADALKRTTMGIYQLQPRHCWGTPEDKAEALEHVRGPDGQKRTPRYLFEQVGEQFRAYDPDTWVRIALGAARAFIDGGAPGVVIPDIRYRNEFAAVRRAGGEVWKIVAHGFAEIRTGHASDQEWRDEPADKLLRNFHGEMEYLLGDIARLIG